MFGFGKHGPDGRYGALVDIGSGSVGIAIVASDPTQKHPEVIWSVRERMPIHAHKDIHVIAKDISTTLLNTLLLLGSAGSKALTKHERGAHIGYVQIGISAPWSYTITKTISYKDQHPFQITEKLIGELVNTAQKQALDVIDENDLMEKLHLEVISRATADITANGYKISESYGQSVRSLSVSHIIAIAQKQIIETLRDGIQKILPKADIQTYSFMLIFYRVLQGLAPDTSEACLVDVTHEATEIGVVRNGVLKYSTHIPYGIYTIAREIVEQCNIPGEEALGYLRGSVDIEQTPSKNVREKLQQIISVYEIKMTELFTRTGDTLSIPRPIFIHTDARTEPFFSEHIKKAAQKATSGDHGIHLVTSKLLKDTPSEDTALLLSADFFHKIADGNGLKFI